MMHEKKFFTSYFEGVLRCNRISNAYSALIKQDKYFKGFMLRGLDKVNIKVGLFLIDFNIE